MMKAEGMRSPKSTDELTLKHYSNLLEDVIIDSEVLDSDSEKKFDK